MKKIYRLIYLLLIAVTLSACGPSPEDIPPEEILTPQFPTAPAEQEVIASAATCTASASTFEDVAVPGDWIYGATEGYAITLVEYGDYQ